MLIYCNGTRLHLGDTPLDIGYAAEKVELKKPDGQTFQIGGQNGMTQIILSAPFIDEKLVHELHQLDSLLDLNALNGISKVLVVADNRHHLPVLDGWLVGYDYDKAFADYYGVRLTGEPLEGELAKALFIVSKDGALFYHQITEDINQPFSLDKVLLQIAAAQNCYTGKGCHG